MTDRQELLLAGIDTLAEELESVGVKVKDDWAKATPTKKLSYVAVIMGLIKQKKDKDEEAFYKGFTELDTLSPEEKQKKLDDFRAYLTLLGTSSTITRSITIELIAGVLKLCYNVLRLFYFLCFDEELRDIYPKSNEEREEDKKQLVQVIEKTGQLILNDNSSGISSEGCERCEGVIQEGTYGNPDTREEPTTTSTTDCPCCRTPTTAEGVNAREEGSVRRDVPGEMAD